LLILSPDTRPFRTGLTLCRAFGAGSRTTWQVAAFWRFKLFGKLRL
jgi:hypothetical protein